MSPLLYLSPILTSELAQLNVDSVAQTAETLPLITASITSAKIPDPHLFLLIDHTPSKIFFNITFPCVHILLNVNSLLHSHDTLSDLLPHQQVISRCLSGNYCMTFVQNLKLEFIFEI